MSRLLNRLRRLPDAFALGEYEALLARARDAGYAQLSVRAFHCELASAGGGPRKVLVHRHDIDRDVRTAKKIFALETRYGAKASYYFRLRTLDFGFMREIEAAGSEASYHYEEVADYARRHRIHCAEEIRRRFPEIREQFIRNFSRITEHLGLRMVTVASHGDFANRRPQGINHELLRGAAAASSANPTTANCCAIPTCTSATASSRTTTFQSRHSKRSDATNASAS
jgi:hypothetical protein